MHTVGQQHEYALHLHLMLVHHLPDLPILEMQSQLIIQFLLQQQQLQVRTKDVILHPYDLHLDFLMP